MPLKTFTQINVTDYELSRVQNGLINFSNQFPGIPILDGRLIESVSLVAGQDNLVETKLDVNWTGWFLARLTANAVVYEGTQTNRLKFLNLRCSADCTVSVWVF